MLTPPGLSPKIPHKAASLTRDSALGTSSSPASAHRATPERFDREQTFYLIYHFFDLLHHVKVASPKQRPYAVSKLGTFVAGAQPDTLHIRSGQMPGDANKPQTLGEQALALLAAYGTPQDVQHCLQKGIIANNYDIHALHTPTALMRAVANGNLETARVLLPHFTKTDLQAVNFFGQTALDLAFQRQDAALLSALRPAYPWFDYLKAYLHHKTKPDDPWAMPDGEPFYDESALLLPNFV
jgi:hypothetical protein